MLIITHLSAAELGSDLNIYGCLVSLSQTDIDTEHAAGADDGVPAAALERFPGGHEGAAVQPSGGGPALQPPDAG